ncbi:MAG: VOC family protein [Alphaproteobacteria bacterium]|nr:VOC family protein [Alphaproteobacteria bacterium]
MNATTNSWAGGVTVAQVRIARPTDRLEAVEAFYRDGLGLPVLARFAGHAGYDGVMLGLPGRDYHLEFTRHREGSPCPAPSRDNLLVLYIPDPAHFEAARRRLEAQGHRPVEPENPWWHGRALTYEDPDGWRVVLCRDGGLSG